MSEGEKLRIQVYLPDTRTGRRAAELFRENVKGRHRGRWLAELILGYFDPEYLPDTESYERKVADPDTVSGEGQMRTRRTVRPQESTVPDTVSGTDGAPSERAFVAAEAAQKDIAETQDERGEAGSPSQDGQFNLAALSGMVDLGNEEDDI